MSKTYQLIGVDTKRVPDFRSGCTKHSCCKWYSGWLLL